jgi:hypothetical protein
MRRGGGGREIKRNAEMWCGENSKERKGNIRERGMRRGGWGREIKRNAELWCGENLKKERGVLGK